MDKSEIEKEFVKYKENVEKRSPINHSWDLKVQERRIRNVQAYKNKNGVIRCKVQLPQCYVNKKVRVIISDKGAKA